MKKKWALLLGCALVVWAVQGEARAEVWEGVVTRVLDGDSFRIKRENQLVTIRLYGIDSPEYGQACWREAKEGATTLLLGKKVRVESMATDRYGRTVALVDFRGQLVNAELVGRGLAWVYRHYCTAQPLCKRLDALEEVARDGRLGIWREGRPVPPWVWKRDK
ncbi:thermonuclease family protein [Desulfobulbus sp.]|uniref:thermonuclease family protein n=1 Tax=Desulfobulbus sp. TaxID=895 RepID=UPI00286F05D1|nr:thermonuclease family protein [Desulfobulbus sp.]